MDVPVAAAGPGEVRVKVETAALNPLDAKLARGDLKAWFPLSFPYVPGTDFAGVVEEIGSGVDAFRVGDAVFGRADPVKGGAFAAAVTLSAELVAHRPFGLDPASAACLPTPAGVAWQALFEVLKLPSSARLLILGSGAVARAAAQLARGRGEVIACGPGAERLRDVGASVVDPGSPGWAAAAARARFVFDTVGGDLQSNVASMLSPGTHIVAIVTPIDADVARTRAITADFVVLETKRTTLDRLAELATDARLDVEIAGSFGFGQIPQIFVAYAAGTLRGKHIMKGDKAWWRGTLPVLLMPAFFRYTPFRNFSRASSGQLVA
jgi:NADPH:quinone reductase-like Zn-dependent oxidoreductase